MIKDNNIIRQLMLNPNTIPVKSTTPAGSPRTFSQYKPSQSMKSTNRCVTPRTKVSTLSVARLSSQDSTLTIPMMMHATSSNGMSSNRRKGNSSLKVYDNDAEFFQQQMQQQDESTPASAFKFKYQSAAKQVFTVMKVRSTAGSGSMYGDNEDEDGENSIPVLGAKNRGILVPQPSMDRRRAKDLELQNYATKVLFRDDRSTHRLRSAQKSASNVISAVDK